MSRKVSFLPAFFIWGVVYAVIDLIFRILQIQDISFYSLYGGYDITLKLLTALTVQSLTLSVYFRWIFKENLTVSLIKSVSVSTFLYVFLYILITGIYLDF
ncbi:hypothetical protein [Persephonella sp.]